MGFLDRLLRRRADASGSSNGSNSTGSYQYQGPKMPQQPLTPREIEELHAKLHPEKHKPEAREPQKPPRSLSEPREWDQPLEDKLCAALDEQTQAQSLLFSRLPTEVRMQIWRYAMGSQKLYLTVKSGYLRQAEKMNDFGWWPKSGLLTVPMLCRAAYTESIACLYSCNTFCIGFGGEGNKLPLTSLRVLLPGQHIASIRHVEVGWHLVRGYTQYFDSHPQAWDPSITVCAPDSGQDWSDACAELAQLVRLKTLKIVLWTSGELRGQLVGSEGELLAPLLEMKHLNYFLVLLPWVQRDDTLWKDAPFRIARKFENRERYGVSLPLLEEVVP